MSSWQEFIIERPTLEGNKEENGEVDVYNGIERNEGNHGNVLHADDADSILNLGNSAGGCVSSAL
jgi:hypothetical protein